MKYLSVLAVWFQVAAKDILLLKVDMAKAKATIRVNLI